MRKSFKILVLTTILLIPAGIYIFLQIFGHNEFDLPIYSENGAEEKKEARIFNFEGLYDINGLAVDNKSFAEEIIILEFVPDLSGNKDRDYLIRRVSDIFRNEGSIRIIRVFTFNNYSGSIPEKITGKAGNNISPLFTGEERMSQRIESAGGYNKIFLLDNKRKIRGSYLIEDFEEIDRLILEVKILLKKEQHA